MSHAILTAEQLPIEEYHSSAPRWLSKSSILDFERHGSQWWQLRYILCLIAPQEATEAMRQGSMLDCYLTEGAEAFDSKYVKRPAGIDLRTKDGRAWAESVAGKEIITEADHRILTHAVDAVHAHPWFDSHIAPSQKQITFRRDTSLGYGLQSRPDFSCLDQRVYIDLKKTCNLATFGRDAINYGYHYQAALADFCSEGAFDHYYLAAVEWELGARFRIFEIPKLAIDHARVQLLDLCNRIHACLESDEWEDVQESPETLEIPAYLQRKME